MVLVVLRGNVMGLLSINKKEQNCQLFRVWCWQRRKSKKIRENGAPRGSREVGEVV